jgi:hypothetical protein
MFVCISYATFAVDFNVPLLKRGALFCILSIVSRLFLENVVISALLYPKAEQTYHMYSSPNVFLSDDMLFQ